MCSPTFSPGSRFWGILVRCRSRTNTIGWPLVRLPLAAPDYQDASVQMGAYASFRARYRICGVDGLTHSSGGLGGFLGGARYKICNLA